MREESHPNKDIHHKGPWPWHLAWHPVVPLKQNHFVDLHNSWSQGPNSREVSRCFEVSKEISSWFLCEICRKAMYFIFHSCFSSNIEIQPLWLADPSCQAPWRNIKNTNTNEPEKMVWQRVRWLITWCTTALSHVLFFQGPLLMPRWLLHLHLGVSIIGWFWSTSTRGETPMVSR